MQKIYFKKMIELNNELKELVSVSVDESISYKLEQGGMRAFGSILINGEYKNFTLKKEFKDSIDIDIMAQYEKIEDRNDFTVKVEDFDYYINDGNLSLIIEANVYGVKDDDDRIIETTVIENDVDDISEDIENLMRLDELPEMIQNNDFTEIIEKHAEIMDLNTSVSEPVKTIKPVEPDEDDDDLGTYYLYVVDSGDTYRSISSHYQIDENMIRVYNHDRPLEKGTIVIIPYS